MSPIRGGVATLKFHGFQINFHSRNLMAFVNNLEDEKIFSPSMSIRTHNQEQTNSTIELGHFTIRNRMKQMDGS